jgi:hypothetical protein
MKRARRIGSRIVRHADRRGASAGWTRALDAWLLAAMVGLLVAGAPGCASNRLPPFQRGTSCSADRVQKYAAAHSMTYEQALGELRKQDNTLWKEEEARQAKLRAEEAPSATDKTKTSGTSSASSTTETSNGAAGSSALRRYEY